MAHFCLLFRIPLNCCKNLNKGLANFGFEPFSALKQLWEQGIQIELTNEALDCLAQLAYDPTYGARPLKRVIQKRILNELSKAILSGSINRDSKVKIELDDKNMFVFLNS